MIKPNRTTSYLLFVSLWMLLGVSTLQAVDFTVTNVNDSGAGSLREAIIAANGAPNGSNIVFAIPGSAPYNIVLNTALPVITGHQTAIEGTTQPGIVLSPAGSLAYGISIQANSCTVRGLEITGFDVGIVISGSHCNNLIHDCTIANNLLKGIDTGTSTNTQIRQNSMYCNGNMPPGGDPLVPSPNAKVPPVILSATTTLITGTATYSAPTPTFSDNIVEIFL